ncbi:MAG: NADH-quinone oxidoreductase subunit A [Thermodesulfovibrionales bacterium]
MTSSGHAIVLWPLVLYTGVVLLLVSTMLLLSYFLGQRHRERATDRPYESGVEPTGSARMRFDVKFYMVAMFFVIFDIEAVFVFSWAIVLRRLGWQGYAAITVFIGLISIILAYLWRIGALDWGPAGEKSDAV